MARRFDIDRYLAEWPYESGDVIARVVKAADGRQVLQMRVEMGLLQMEISNRPDGTTPHGLPTYLDYLRTVAVREPDDWEMSEEHCTQADREFLQFYHRRICWLTVRNYQRALLDAEHSLELMDFVAAHCSDKEWVLSHEQYRPFVMFHHTQASALAALEQQGPEAAVEALSQGLQRFQELFAMYEAEEEFEEDEFVLRLQEMRQALRAHYQVPMTLDEQLADAVATEQYELAARLRDEIHRREIRSSTS